jgi:serine/threonine protein kinase
MGEVWEADDTVLGRRVALKVLVQELADDARATKRFVREARATAKLTHPNVTRIYDFGRDGGLPYLVMELLEGDTLADRLVDGPMPPAEAARIGAAVADALDAAHGQGIIHRDVKPSNVLLTPAGEVKVMDFGIAAAADETHSTTGSGLYGTAAYISPERAAGHPATPAADIYSLGAVLYELLTGRPPFLGDSPMLVVRAHLHERPSRCGSSPPGCRPGWPTPASWRWPKTRPSGLPRPLPWPSACAPYLPGLGRPFRETPRREPRGCARRSVGIRRGGSGWPNRPESSPRPRPDHRSRPPSRWGRTEPSGVGIGDGRPGCWSGRSWWCWRR